MKALSTMTIKPKEAAELASVSTRTITRMCERGQLEAVRFGRSWRINKRSFMRLLGEDTEGATTND